MQIHLSNKFQAADVALTVQATHLLQILDPDEPAQRPPSIPVENCRRVDCHDLATYNHTYTVPGDQHAQAIIDFARTLPEDASLLVHCHSARSRSPAAIILVIAARAPDFASAETKIRAFFAANPLISPNHRLIDAGDRVLGLGRQLTILVADLKSQSLFRQVVIERRFAQ
jgi:predicted protein tyrosine phosphatase